VQDVLQNDSVKLDKSFKYSFILDLLNVGLKHHLELGPDFQNFLGKSYENLRKILGILKLCTYDEVTKNL